MGLILSGDEFCHRIDKALMDLSGIRKLVDNIHICTENYRELKDKTRSVFIRC